MEVEVLIVGGGPAGLTAAVYLGRFRRRTLVVDAGEARALRIPLTRNCPGFPDGLSGATLISRLMEQARRYGADIQAGEVRTVTASANGFIAEASVGTVRARHLLLATGLVDVTPAYLEADQALADGSLRLCPICDGYETAGKHVGVLGPAEDALPEASFLRNFSQKVSCLCQGTSPIKAHAQVQAGKEGIAIWENVTGVRYRRPGFEVVLGGDETRQLDVLYIAMGCRVRSDLARKMGAAHDEEDFIRVDRNQKTTLKGLYAAGDVATGLKQIAVAFGHAAVAATEIHNHLRQQE